MPERFWSLMLVMGSALMVVNTGLLEAVESFLVSCAFALRANAAISNMVNKFFIVTIIMFVRCKGNKQFTII